MNASITDEEYNKLFVSGSSPSILYGLPKVHKTGIPLRPILSAFKAASYNLAKFLISILQPLTENQYTLKNTYEFKNIIDSSEVHRGAVLASFDITSLNTNVTIKETVDIVLDH